MATKTKVASAEETIKDIRRETRRKWNAEEKIRIVLEGLRGEESIAELCRRDGLSPNLSHRDGGNHITSGAKSGLEAGKARLTGDTKRQANSSEVDGLRQENEQLKQVVAELFLKNRVLKKSVLASENGELED